MKHLIPVILMLIIILMPALALLSLRKEIGLKHTSEGKILYFYKSHDLNFSFTSPKVNFNSLVLRFQNTLLRNNQDLYFDISDDSGVLREVKISGLNIKDGDYIRFAFTPIVESKNKQFYVTLKSPDSDYDSSLGVFTDRQENLVLTTYHIPDLKFNQILNIYSSLLGRVLADKFFIVIWLSLLGSLFWLIAKQVND